MALPGLMDYVQEVSYFHTHSIDGLFEYYDRMNLVWVLTHWHVEVARQPRVGEHINISTWPVQFKGYFGERGFAATDSAGETILRANSNWLMLDRNVLKPARASEELIAKYGPPYPFPIEKNFALPKPDGFATLSTHKYTPTRRDIDTNNHVNNVRYLEWVCCHIPDDIYHNYRAQSLKVAYKKETLLGDDLEIKLMRRDCGHDGIEILAIIEKNGQTATEVYTKWQSIQ